MGQNIIRTTARKYFIYFNDKKTIQDWRNANCGSLIWWTFERSRPKGHIGVHVKQPFIWQSGSSTGPSKEKLFDGGFWDKNFVGSKKVLE